MKTEIYTNRYGDKFTFTELPDGNIQWSGDFQYCRLGYPNDYTEAYLAHTTDGGTMSLSEFKEEVHRAIYDKNGDYINMSDTSQVYAELVKSKTDVINMSDTSQVYAELVKSKTDVINMVDPSGGAYLASGMEIMGKVIKEFKPNRDGYLIVTEK